MIKKHTISFFITVISLVFLMALSVSAAFPDIQKDTPLEKAAEFLSQHSIVTGYPDGSFGTENTITRAEIVTMLCRYIGASSQAENEKDELCFTDLSVSHWANGYINVSRNNNIVEGYPDGSFRPDAQVKTEEAVKMIMCLLEDHTSFESSDPWYKTYIDAANDRKLLTNVNSAIGTPVTRGDVALMLYNAAAVLGDEYEVTSWKNVDYLSVYRDYSEKTNGRFSYCLESREANDVRLNKTITGEPDELYIISADIKTENVVNVESPDSGVGAQISAGNYDHSRCFTGDTDWRTVRKAVRADGNGNIAFSLDLGYWSATTTGKVWYSNIRCEKIDDIEIEDDTWNFLYVILTNASIDETDPKTNKHIHISHTRSADEIEAAKYNIKDLASDLYEMSRGKIKAEVDIITSDALINDYVYSDGYGFYVDNWKANKYLTENDIDFSEYDHVIFVECLPGLSVGYGGLGGTMISGDVGFSFIMQTTPPTLQGIKDDPNPFICAMFVHEFLHSIDTYSNSLGFACPALHDAEELGYTDEIAWKQWYTDYINKEVKSNNGLAGIDPMIWKLPPSIFN